MTTENTATGAAVVCDHPGCLARVEVATDPANPHEVDLDAGDAAAAAGWGAARLKDYCPTHIPPPPPEPVPLAREEAERLLRALDDASLLGFDGDALPPRMAHVVVREVPGYGLHAAWGGGHGYGASEGLAFRVLVDNYRREVEAKVAGLVREAERLREAARRAPALEARAAAIRAALEEVREGSAEPASVAEDPRQLPLFGGVAGATTTPDRSVRRAAP